MATDENDHTNVPTAPPGDSPSEISGRDKEKQSPYEFSKEAKAVVKKFVHKISHDGLHNLRLQYNDLKAFTPPEFEHTASDANPKKCRYKDIVCIDKTRISLSWPSGCTDGDFVHANWVVHDLLDNKFICTQAPMDNTVGDFWRLVWQEKVKQIIMLCRCIEMGKSKCAQYWPEVVDESKQMTYGLVVKCVKVDRSNPNFVHTRLCMIYETEKRYLDHRQWTTWPDKSVPQTPLAPFRLLQFTRRHTKYPSLIHCSAGVGRTGTMVAIEMIYKSLYNAAMPEPVQLLRSLRSQRFLAVQTEDQYVYCHYAILQFAFAKKMASRHDVKMFCKEYVNYVKLVADNGGKAPPLNATKAPPDCAVCRNQKADQQEQSSGCKEKGKDKSAVSSLSKRKPLRKKDKSQKQDVIDISKSDFEKLELMDIGKSEKEKGSTRRKKKEKNDAGSAVEKGGEKPKEEKLLESPPAPDTPSTGGTPTGNTPTASEKTVKTNISLSKLSPIHKVQSMPNMAVEGNDRQKNATKPVPVMAAGIPTAEVRSQFAEMRHSSEAIHNNNPPQDKVDNKRINSVEKPEKIHLSAEKPKPIAAESLKPLEIAPQKAYTIQEQGGTKKIIYHRRNTNRVCIQAQAIPKGSAPVHHQVAKAPENNETGGAGGKP